VVVTSEMRQCGTCGRACALLVLRDGALRCSSCDTPPPTQEQRDAFARRLRVVLADQGVPLAPRPSEVGPWFV